MTKCIYNTDHSWFLYLRQTGTTGPVNFWRKDKRRLHLNDGASFYFRVRLGGGNYYIAGEAQFREMKVQTVKAAWLEFEFRNGVSKYVDFLDAIRRVIHVESPDDNTDITSIVLDNCLWYPDDSFIRVSEEIFPRNILGSKFYKDTDLEFLPQHQLPPLPDSRPPDTNFNEGAVRLARHKRIERSSRLISEVKSNREWICEICALDFKTAYGHRYIEAHHKVPLSLMGETISTPEDIALLCPNCHSAVHKYMEAAPAILYADAANSIRNIMRTQMGQGST